MPPNRNPALWWLNYEFPDRRPETILSMVRVQDFWIMTTDRAIWKFSVDFTDRPVVRNIHNF